MSSGARGRPFGEVSLALLQAARVGPGTVAQLAERACVGYDAARFKAKDLVRAGALLPLTDVRPRVLAAAGAVASSAAAASAGLTALPRSFWQRELPNSAEAGATT